MAALQVVVTIQNKPGDNGQPEQQTNVQSAWVEEQGLVGCENPALVIAALQRGIEVMQRHVSFEPPKIVRGVQGLKVEPPRGH